ncbi:MAG: hypothetical protein ACREN8_01825 [Candidatus Dormibacteraceae bacterium]
MSVNIQIEGYVAMQTEEQTHNVDSEASEVDKVFFIEEIDVVTTDSLLKMRT